MFNYVPIKHKEMSFVSNGGKFKLYAVLNNLIFPTPTQLTIIFERAIELDETMLQKQKSLLCGQFERSCAQKNKFFEIFSNTKPLSLDFLG
jgi:hypothetical protein